MKQLTRITLDPAVMGGKACIRGMRVTVGTIVGLLATGRSREEILKAYPYLEPEDIDQAKDSVGEVEIPVPNSSRSPVPPLNPGPPPQMLSEAIRHLKQLPFDAAQRADAFEALAQQIENHSAGVWNATRGTGTDGSIIFLGRQGEGLVVNPDGRIFRGTIGRGIKITPDGLRPDYNSLKPLD
jgi:uncharacterized protein (DUF433 family)